MSRVTVLRLESRNARCCPLNRDLNSRIDLEEFRQRCAQCGIRQMCLPAALDQPDRRRLSTILSTRVVAAGEYVYRQGDRFRDLYLIRRGAIKTWMSNAEGDMQILAFHLPGELTGLEGVADTRHPCHAQALTETELCRIPYDRLDALASELPSLRGRLMNIISREFVLEQEHIMMMSARPAIERLALFLQTLLQRVEAHAGPRSVLRLDMARWEIANFLAMATETVSRLLSELQKSGAIRIHRREVKVLDLNRLVEISGEDLGELPCATAPRSG